VGLSDRPKKDELKRFGNDNVLILADGRAWQIVGKDAQALVIIARLKEILQLTYFKGPCRRLSVATCDKKGDLKHVMTEDLEVCVPLLGDVNYSAGAVFALAIQPVCLDIQSGSGLFIHGALVEKDGRGIIMTGPPGVGKTTASNRLPSSWKCLSDDKTLVVCDNHGQYRAHPWPTWNRFAHSGSVGSWEVNHSVPLKGMFFLTQAQRDRVEPIRAGQSACMLVETCQQAAFLSLELGDTDKGLRIQRLQRFKNICALVKAIPSFMLHISLTGSFWDEIDKALDL